MSNSGASPAVYMKAVNAVYISSVFSKHLIENSESEYYEELCLSLDENEPVAEGFAKALLLKSTGSIIEAILRRDPHEVEFMQCVQEVVHALERVIAKNTQYVNIMERMLEPERMYILRVQWIDDRGETHVNRGFRVQFNRAVGIQDIDEGVNVNSFADVDSHDSDINETAHPEGIQRSASVAHAAGGKDMITGLLASLLEVVRTTVACECVYVRAMVIKALIWMQSPYDSFDELKSIIASELSDPTWPPTLLNDVLLTLHARFKATPDMAVTFLEIARIFATKVPGKIDADVLQLLWKSIMEYEEHEKRAWSVDFSRTEPSMLVSGSDDCKWGGAKNRKSYTQEELDEVQIEVAHYIETLL